MLAKIIKHDGNKMTIEFDNELNAEYLNLLARDGENYVQVKLIDNDPITVKQNALSHVLIRDIAIWQGDVPKYVEGFLKYDYTWQTAEKFSHTTATKDEARQWIDYLIEFVVRWNIPLKKRYEYLTQNNSFFYYSCKYRKCCICGKPHAQIHHVQAVGNRGRKQTDHRLFPFASLCWKHHNEAHQIGQSEFLELHDIIPVYLDREALIKIGIMSNAQIMRFDDEYETESLFNKAKKGSDDIGRNQLDQIKNNNV